MRKTTRQSPIDRFLALSNAERAAETARFDQEFIADSGKPLTAEQRKLWAKAKRKRGRPTVGAGSKKFLVSMEKTLLSELDRTASDAGMTRSAVLSAATRALIARPQTLNVIGKAKVKRKR